MESQPRKINIAIDGYSSCGKGTLARWLAAELGYIFIDTGAMYRAVTFYMLQNGIPVQDESAVVAALHAVKIAFRLNPATGKNEIELNGENVEAKIRTMEVAGQVSQVAKISGVRKFLVQLQKEIGRQKGVVMDGRDIGTVVLPDAELKIFMTANPEIRAQRRYTELARAGVHTTYEDVLENLQQRDRIDSSREDSPLTLTDAYRVLDNSHLTVPEQNQLAMDWVRDLLS